MGGSAAAAEAPGKAARDGMSCPGLTCAHPAPRRSCPWGRTGCCGHAPPQLPAGVGRTRPCACKNPLAARAGAQSPGARGSPVGTVGTDRGEGRTRCSLSAAPLPRPQGCFFFPQSRQHPPANISAWLKAAYGPDRTHSVLWMRPPCQEDQPGWMQGQRGGRTPHLLP